MIFLVVTILFYYFRLGTNTGHSNAAITEMYSGGLTKDEAVLAKQKANAYKQELDYQLNLKKERVAREKSSKKEEERQERMMLDQQFAAINSIAGGGRKRIQPGGQPLPKQSMLPTQNTIQPLNHANQYGQQGGQGGQQGVGGPMQPMGMGQPQPMARIGFPNSPSPIPPQQQSNMPGMQQQSSHRGGRASVQGHERGGMYNGERAQILPRSRPIGGSDSMARALSPTAMGMPPANMMIDQGMRDGILPQGGYGGGGPEVHRKYRQGLKDPAEMEQLMIKRQREQRQAAILEDQLKDQKQRKAKKKAEEKKLYEQEELRLEREREDILRNDKDREKVNAKFQAGRSDLARQIEEKKRQKQIKILEEKEYERKLQEKCDRDNEELQRQYDEERGIKTEAKKKSTKEETKEKNST